MGDSSEKFGDTGIIELIGKIMVIAIVILLFVVVLIFCLRLYAKYILHRRSGNPSSVTGRRRPLDFAAGQSEIAVSRLGLEHSVLETLPIIIFDPKDFKEGLECSVCLSEISGGEKTRLLPKCNHGFHLDCIDMWFESHSTCPLCRDPVKIQNSGDQLPLEVVIIQAPTVENSPNFPTNVLIYGDETRVNTSSPCVEENNHHHLNSSHAIVEPLSSSSSSSSSSLTGSTSGTLDGISMVDIPRQINEDDDQKSPLPTRLRSIKRLLSYNNNNRRVNPSSSRNLDLEQGGGTG